MDKSDSNDRIGKSPKKPYKFRDSTKAKSKRSRRGTYKNPENPDSDSDSDWQPVDDTVHSENDDSEHASAEEPEFDTRQFQKFIQKIFPSKSGKERIRQMEKLDKLMKKTNLGRTDIIKKKRRRRKRNEKIDKAEEETIDDDDDDDAFEEAVQKEEARMLVADLDDDGDDEMDEDEIKDMLRQNMKFNIIFTVGANPDEWDQEESSEEEEVETEGESSDEKVESKKKEAGKQRENYKKNQAVRVKYRGWEQWYTGRIKKVHTLCTDPSYSRYDVELDNEEYDVQERIKGKYIEAVPKEDLDMESALKEVEALVKMRHKKGKTAMLKKFKQMAQAQERKTAKEQKEKQEKHKAKNVSTLRKLLRAPNIMNDFKYFKDMEIDAQKKIIKELRAVNKYACVEKPYRLRLLESEIPVQHKAAALKKINTLNYMDPGSGEYYKIKQWVDTFMSIPFGETKKLPLTIDDGIETCNKFMEDAKKQLDECVYGLDDAKMQILQLVGQWISNPESIGTAIAIKGPPGTGKTTLIKEGISKILQRPFAFLALGGATDSSFLEGHSYTYEGSTWGKIVNILINSKVMNPVIYFDELDKISDTPKGEEITGILTHLTDTTQNSQFHDKYFASIDFDLSKALFIFSYNDEDKINPVLKDRMYRIHTGGYTIKQKLTIAKEYLIPKIERNVNFDPKMISIEDDALSHIIENYTDKEKGVRNLKRCLEIVYTKLNLYRLMKSDSNLFNKEKTLKVEFPFTVSTEVIKKLVKIDESRNVPMGMYM